jgi:hypothetical protein
MQQNTTTEIKYDYNDINHKPPFPNTQYFELPADENEEVMRIAIGKNGCHFCSITENNNIPYIFHNKETNKIVIWAPVYKAQKVMTDLNNQLNYARQFVKNKYNINKTNINEVK